MKMLMKDTFKTLVIIVLFPLFTLAQSQSIELSSERSNQAINEPPSFMNTRDINNDSAWIHYDDVENFDSWGFLISGEIYDVVAKWDSAGLVNYGSYGVSKIKFIVVNDDPIFKVKVWVGDNFTEVYSKDVDNIVVNGWTTIELDSLIKFDNTENLYIGYNVDYTSSELGGFVTATDDGPAIDDYGNLVRLDGYWYSDYNNHNLRAMLTEYINADFTSDIINVCEGSSVNFTDMSGGTPVSWNWTFEGGTPSSSTDENPTITYNTAGTYDVQLIVSSSGGLSDTIVKEDYINVVILSDTPNTPDGDTQVCSEYSTQYWTNDVQYAEYYEWVADPAAAGSFSGDGDTTTFLASESWSGDFTVKVRAVNVCGNSDWSGELNCSVNPLPIEYNLSSGGDACEGSEGVEITLDGSESGVDYYLHHSGDTVAGPIAGTGSELSFGMFSDGGYYNATAYNGSCSQFMIGDALINEELLPEVAGTPSGLDTICSQATSEYEIEEVEGAITYVWTIIPEEAGIIEGDSLIGTVTWDASYEGIAEIAARGENDCGAGPSGPSLEVMVYAEPIPEIAGDNLVCQQDFGTYSVNYSEYSEYNWTVSGGNITEGQGTSEITVFWTAEQGSVNPVNVTETKIDNCEGIADTFEVTIDQCVGINEIDNRKLSIYPNPANEVLNIELSNLNSDEVFIQIINLKGQSVYAENYQLSNGALNTLIMTNKLMSGVYTVSVSTNNNTIFHKKLVIVK